MTQHQNTDTLPADTTTTEPIATVPPQDSRDTHRGEEVNAMARKFRSGRSRTDRSTSGRAWDELSATDREVLLESVRQRREAQAAQDLRELQIFAMRSHR